MDLSTLLVQECDQSVSAELLHSLDFFRLFDAMIVSRMISWLYSRMYSLAFVLMVLYISAYYIRYLLSPFSAISRRFVIRAHVGDDILDFWGLLIALA